MKRFINSNILKLVAIVAMTIDHIGKMILNFYYTSGARTAENVMTIIGRVAFPIFIFLIIEGFTHTKDIKKYFLRLGIMAVSIAVFYYLVAFIPIQGFSGDYILTMGNIFIDLICFLALLYFLNHKKQYIKLLAIIPTAFLIAYFVLFNGDKSLFVLDPLFKKILAPFNPQYAILTLLLFYSYFLLSKLTNYLTYKRAEKNNLVIDAESTNLNVRVFSYSFVLLLISALMWGLSFLTIPLLSNYYVVLYSYILLAAPFILLYNGKQRKWPTWTKYAFYLYYPLHLVIIFLIVYLTTL